MSTLEDQKGRLFRTLVVMGGTLALGCGGVAQESVTDEGPTSTGAAPGIGGTGGVGGIGGTGGVTSTGATTSTGGIVFPTGGTGTGGMETITPGPFVCPPEQWDCGAGPFECVSNDYLGYELRLPGSCTCNPEKPLTVSDCAEGESVVCGKAVADSQGRWFDTAVHFDCRCEPNVAEYDCSVCDRFGVAHGCAYPDGSQPITCGCALPVLK